MTEIDPTLDHKCQIHPNEVAVVRLSTPSAANTPIVRDLCVDCLMRRLWEREAFGRPQQEEILRLDRKHD
ncbi:hypothetical protein [Halorubrum tailed virus BLv36]|nr:hypothetical protein [Halorubrum tailed virus BLv36]